MKIDKVRVQNFRSFKDSGEIKIDEKITTMVGKNESGKTNFLKALESINRDYEYSNDDFCYYSEDSGKGLRERRMTTIWFETDKADKDRLRKIHKELAKLERIRVTKYFDDHYEFETEPQLDIASPLFDRAHSSMVDELSSLSLRLEGHAKRYEPFASAVPDSQDAQDEFFSSELSDVESINEAFSTLYDSLRGLSNQDAQVQKEIASAIERFDNIKAELIGAFQINDKILESLPNFIYFENPDLLQDVVDITQYKRSPKKYRTFRSLEKLANLDLGELASEEGVFYRRFETDEASATVTGMVNESWKQDKVNVKIGVDGKRFFVLWKMKLVVMTLQVEEVMVFNGFSRST